MAGFIAPSPQIGRVERVGISEPEMQVLNTTVLVARLVAGGVSRLTAERFIEIRRGSAEAGRARPHILSRRR
jgi:hypothetical protein